MDAAQPRPEAVRVTRDQAVREGVDSPRVKRYARASPLERENLLVDLRNARDHESGQFLLRVVGATDSGNRELKVLALVSLLLRGLDVGDDVDPLLKSRSMGHQLAAESMLAHRANPQSCQAMVE